MPDSHHPYPSQAGGWTRRNMLRVGSLGLAGFSLSELFRAEAAGQGTNRRRAAKSCILFYMEGGPSHLDMWDMKPEAPVEVRGEFKPISTTVPGVQVCDHLPMLARQMHLLAQIRSVHHKIVDHNAGTYYALTGRSPVRGNGLIVGDAPDNFPAYGSVLARLRPVSKALPPFVHLPDIIFNNGNEIPGQLAGFLGGGLNPLVAGDPSAPGYQIPGLALPKDMPLARLRRRSELLARLNRTGAVRQSSGAFAKYQDQAMAILSASKAKQAFDLSSESPATRERYGLPDRKDRSVSARKFGGLPHLGQTTLMARRLVEAGVRLVTVCCGRRFDQAWDGHRNHFSVLKKSLLPYADRAFSALLEDLHQRGLLEETLVVAMGEFGRTPRIGQITSSAGADQTGRDHWPHCYTVLMAGGGITGGAIHGASDRYAAYPARDPVTPEDIAATIYHAMGIDPETQIYDQLNKPQSVALGSPIRELFSY